MKNAVIKRGKSPTLFLIFFAIIWIAIYGFFMFPIHVLMFTGTQVSGVVTDVEVHEDDDGDTYEPTVKYTCGGITTTQSQGYSSSTYYRVGQKVKVYCNENNPTKFAIKSFGKYLMLLFPLVGLLLLFFGVKNLRGDIRRKRLKNKLSQYGVHTEAIISEIKNTGARINDIPGYQIIANCDGKVFTSETVYAKLPYILKEGDKIDVYVDPVNSDDYWMDTDSIFERPIRDDYVPINPNNLNGNQNLSQKFLRNPAGGESSDIAGNSIMNNTRNITPRPPQISDKKCPIHRVKNGIGAGIIFGLIGLGIIVSFFVISIDSRDLSGALPATLFGGTFLIIGLIILIPKIIRNRKKKRLMEGGIKKEGMVTEISHNNTIINNQKGYNITAIYDGKLYKSTAVYADIYYLIEEGDEIDIYVGTGGDDDYWVDVDSIFYRELKPSYYDRPRSIGDVFNIIKETIRNSKQN